MVKSNLQFGEIFVLMNKDEVWVFQDAYLRFTTYYLPKVLNVFSFRTFGSMVLNVYFLYRLSFSKEESLYPIAEKVRSVTNQEQNYPERNTCKEEDRQSYMCQFLTVKIGFSLCHKEIALCIGTTVDHVA